MSAPIDDQLAALFPLGGPYDDATTRAAARSVAGLVRYLNHATRHAGAVSEPATVDAAVWALAEAVGGMGQLLRQIGERLAELAQRPGAYSTIGEPAMATCREALDLLGGAQSYLATAHEHLTWAGEQTSRIGTDLPSENEAS